MIDITDLQTEYRVEIAEEDEADFWNRMQEQRDDVEKVLGYVAQIRPPLVKVEPQPIGDVALNKTVERL